MNPLLDPKFFIPDGEAHVMPDGRLYLYGSMDLSGQQSYCSSQYHVFSTNDPALRNWVDHGISFSSCPEHMAGLCPEETILYAPDAACRDGKYYLYFCTSDGTEGVAFSDTPYGPFTSPKAIEGASGDSIDPAVFVDQDGQAYYFWGQFNLKGAKMNPDMCTLDLSSVTTGILTEQEHGFHEGACIRRRGDKYYLVYTDISRGRATCLGYAMADSPLGPYRKCGILIDNTGCDPQSWNNHGSIEEFQGQWYVFYHRSSQNGIFSRRMCAEPIYFRPDGTIAEVEQTSGGAEGPLDAFLCDSRQNRLPHDRRMSHYPHTGRGNPDAMRRRPRRRAKRVAEMGGIQISGLWKRRRERFGYREGERKTIFPNHREPADRTM